MKILLLAVNAKYIHSNLAVYSLRAYAGANRNPALPVEIEIAEYTINNRPEEILAGVYKAEPDLLCVSCYIWNISCVTEVIEEYHKLCPGVPVWVGGPEVSYESERFLREHPAVTGVMRGEGEQTFLELAAFYAEIAPGASAGMKGAAGVSAGAKAGPESLQDIRGIVFREGAGVRAAGEQGAREMPDGERICATGEREPVDMSAIPFCYEDMSDFENRIIYYESSRGCPFCCSYCLSSVERRLRFRDIALVKKELAFFLEKRVPQVKFVDRTFNCKHEHAMEIWQYMKEHDNGVTNFHFEISADLLSPAELALICGMRPGLIQLEIGVQSTNPATIREIHRRTDLSRLKENVRKIRQWHRVHVHLDLIAGLPYEDYVSFARSFDEVYALRPDQLQLGFLKVLKGSYMYAHAAEYGLVYRTQPPYEVLRTNWLGYGELLALGQTEEMVEVYYNSGQFETTMKLFETCYESPFALYQSLGSFYERRGYFSMSHSRIRRSEILLEFAEAQKKELLPVLRESLIFDLYCRENMKSRPAWAADASEWRELTRKYCKNGKMSHVERFFYRFPDRETLRVSELPGREREPVYVLFDYERRDPVNRQADYCYIAEGVNIR